MRWLLNLVFSLPCIVATLVNVTVDDTQGTSIVYTPSDAWNTAADCVGCTAHPNPSSMFDNTWHDSTFNPQPGSNNYPNQVLSASLNFKGSAIYVYCALALTTTSPAGNSDMSFLIDGVLSGTFAKPAPGTDGYEYNVLVYSNTTLSSGSHTLTIQNGHVNGPKSLILLDYIIYSFDDEQTNGGTTTSSSSSSTSTSTSSLSTSVSSSTSTSLTQSIPSESSSTTGIPIFQTTPPSAQPSAQSDTQSIPSTSQPSPSASQTSAHSLSTGAIAGIAVGTVIPALLLILLLFFCCYRRRRSEQDMGNDITIYDPSTMGSSYRPAVPVVPVTTTTTATVPATRPIGAAAPLLQSPFTYPESTSGSQTSISAPSTRSAPITASGITGTSISLSQFPSILPAESTSSQSQTSGSNWTSRAPRNIPSPLGGPTSISEVGEEEPPPVYEETVTRNSSRLYPREKPRIGG